MDDQRVSPGDRLLRAARVAPAFEHLGDERRRAVVRDCLARQEGVAGRALNRLRDRKATYFGDVYELHWRQSTFEDDVAAWRRQHERRRKAAGQ